jgi:hypothetical protein
VAAAGSVGVSVPVLRAFARDYLAAIRRQRLVVRPA